MATPKTLDEAMAEAENVVGDKATMPKPKADVDKMHDAVVQEFRGFQKALTDLYTGLLLIEKALKSYQYGMDQNAAIYEKADFGLDSKGDAKKIKQARKIFDDFFAPKQKTIDERVKGFNDLYNRVIDVMQGKWFPPE